MVNGDATKLAAANQDRIDAAIERGFPGQVFRSTPTAIHQIMLTDSTSHLESTTTTNTLPT